MQRRAVLASIGCATTGVLAGCIADGTPSTDNGGGDRPNGTDGEDGADSTDTGDRTGTPTGGPSGTEPESRISEADVEPTVVEHAIETSGAECMSGEDGDHVDVEFGSEDVTLVGVAAAPNPCHEAAIESTSVENGELRVDVGLDSTAEVCGDCVGAIAYSATIDVDGADGLDTVTVRHGEDGEVHTARRGTEESSPTPTDYPSHEEASREPDPDLRIGVESDYDETAELSVTVVRESGETVYDETLTVEPGSGREIYNLEAADPDGVEAFDVRAAMDGQTESVRVETSACYGSVEVMITQDGTLHPIYSIC